MRLGAYAKAVAVYERPWWRERGLNGIGLATDGPLQMVVDGAAESDRGILVGFMPRYFAYVVTLWLWGIIVNLLTYSGYYDIALRDFGLSLGALALGRLAQAHYAEQQMMGETETTSRETRTAPATETASSERRAA